MSFLPHQSDNGLQPWEYLPAEAGTYKVGQLLNCNVYLRKVSEQSATTPPYLCMAEKTVENGELLPVIRVTGDVIYETQLADAAMDACVGAMLGVAKGGEGLTEAQGSFEVTFIEGIDAGNTVRGRFH